MLRKTGSLQWHLLGKIQIWSWMHTWYSPCLLGVWSAKWRREMSSRRIWRYNRKWQLFFDFEWGNSLNWKSFLLQPGEFLRFKTNYFRGIADDCDQSQRSLRRIFHIPNKNDPEILCLTITIVIQNFLNTYIAVFTCHMVTSKVFLNPYLTARTLLCFIWSI